MNFLRHDNSKVKWGLLPWILSFKSLFYNDVWKNMFPVAGNYEYKETDNENVLLSEVSSFLGNPAAA